MHVRDRKEEQRSNLFDRQSYLPKNATLLEMGTGDGIFASYLKKTYGYTIWWYDIQNLLSKDALLDEYHVWWNDVLQNILMTKKFNGIIIAYTLHHMSDDQISSLIALLRSYDTPIVVL